MQGNLVFVGTLMLIISLLVFSFYASRIVAASERGPNDAHKEVVHGPISSH